MSPPPSESKRRDLSDLGRQNPVASSQQDMRRLAESLPGAVFQLEADQQNKIRYNYVSPKVEHVLGLSVEAILSDPLLPASQVLPQDSAKLFGGYRDSTREMEPFSVEVRVRHCDGRQRWIRTHAAPTQTEQGFVWNGYWDDVTDEVEAQQRLRDSEAKLAKVTGSVPGAVFQIVVSPDGVPELDYVSAGIDDLCGIPQDEATGNIAGLIALVLPDHQVEVARILTELGSKEDTQHSDYMIRHGRTGKERWLRGTATSFRRADGAMVLNGYWQDTTDLQELQRDLTQARDEAREAQGRLQDITESLPGVVFRMVIEDKGAAYFTDVTDAALEVYGVPREVLLRDADIIRRVTHPDDVISVGKKLADAAREGRAVSYDCRIRKPDGKTYWLRCSAAPRKITEGIAWVGYATDVSAEHDAQDRALEAQRQMQIAQEQEKTAQERLRTIFDHTRIGLVMIDEDRNFSNANPSLRDLLDIEDEQDFARNFPEFSPPTQPDGRPSMEKALEVIEAAFTTGYHRFDWMHQTRDGQPRPCEVALTRVVLNDSPYLFATMTDLRERRQHEAELEAATEAAKAASKAKSEFLANMSHEIRTPMNAIVGMSHLGLTSTEPERQRDYLGKIDNAAQSLLQIINDILDFSKIEAGRLSLEKIRFTLSDVIKNLTDLLRLRADEKGLALEIDLDPNLPEELCGDPLRLGQVLLNLAGNAVKFTRSGQVRIESRLLEQGPDFVRLHFAVHDSGIGITEEQQKHLFQAFAQADSSTTRK